MPALLLGAAMTQPDMRLADAIMQAAENLGADGAGKDGIIGWLEAMRCTHPAIFELVIAKVKQKEQTDD